MHYKTTGGKLRPMVLQSTLKVQNSRLRTMQEFYIVKSNICDLSGVAKNALWIQIKK